MTITVSITGLDAENQAAVDAMCSEFRPENPPMPEAYFAEVIANIIEDKRVQRLRHRVGELGAAIEAAPYEVRMALDAQIQSALASQP